MSLAVSRPPARSGAQEKSGGDGPVLAVLVMPAEKSHGLEWVRARETLAQGQGLPQRLGAPRGPKLDEIARWIVALQVDAIVPIVHG